MSLKSELWRGMQKPSSVVSSNSKSQNKAQLTDVTSHKLPDEAIL